MVRLHSFGDTAFITCTRESCVSPIPVTGNCTLGEVHRGTRWPPSLDASGYCRNQQRPASWGKRSGFHCSHPVLQVGSPLSITTLKSKSRPPCGVPKNRETLKATPDRFEATNYLRDCLYPSVDLQDAQARGGLGLGTDPCPGRAGRALSARLRTRGRELAEFPVVSLRIFNGSASSLVWF